jgi:hypothetical protein
LWFRVEFVVGFAGCGPAATYFLCFAEESKQRKANPMSRRAKAARFPLFLKIIGGCATRGEFVFYGFIWRLCAPLRQCSPKSPDNISEKVATQHGDLVRDLRDACLNCLF